MEISRILFILLYPLFHYIQFIITRCECSTYLDYINWSHCTKLLVCYVWMKHEVKVTQGSNGFLVLHRHVASPSSGMYSAVIGKSDPTMLITEAGHVYCFTAPNTFPYHHQLRNLSRYAHPDNCLLYEVCHDGPWLLVLLASI